VPPELLERLPSVKGLVETRLSGFVMVTELPGSTVKTGLSVLFEPSGLAEVLLKGGLPVKFAGVVIWELPWKPWVLENGGVLEGLSLPVAGGVSAELGLRVTPVIDDKVPLLVITVPSVKPEEVDVLRLLVMSEVPV
jgi:hypothetical protein